MAKRGKAGEFPIELLTGGKPAAESLVRRGMVDLEKELTRQFREERSSEVQNAEYMKQIREGLLPGLETNKRVAAGVRGLRTLDERLSKGKLSAPSAGPEESRIFAGSIGATVVPPFNYQWSWNQTSGSPSLSVAANRLNGQMNFNIWNAGRDASGSARAAVGIYFRPMISNGILRLWANPAFNYSWWTICTLASAHSDAYIGLYVGRYTLAGGFDGAPVNQQISLWNDDSWWSGAGSHSGSNSGFPLFSQFNVDSNHWYALWVWCGGRATGAGWGTFSGSGAGSNLSVATRAMTWELF